MDKVLKVFLLLLLVASASTSCTTDEVELRNSEELLSSEVVQRGEGEVYPAFETLFRELYHGSYTVGATVEVQADNTTYKVTEVLVSTPSNRKAYFIETSRGVLYEELNTATGTLLEYEVVTGGYSRTAYNLNNDPLYATYGFSPIRPATAAKFWGWGGPHLEDGPCVGGVRNWVQDYYVLGINTGATRDVLGLDGQPLTAPCE